MKRPTQADVARLAGVSRATVSNVMNGRVDDKIPVSKETRQRVLDAIAELNYTPDIRAQSLRSGSTKTVGVMLPVYENPFFWQILTGISAEAERNNYSVLLTPGSDAPQREQYLLRELAQQRIDGLILLSSSKHLPNPVAQQLHQSAKPIVQISSADSKFAYAHDHLHDTYADGARALLEHLIDLGHRRIGFVYGVVHEPQGYDRLLTYEAIMKETGFYSPDLVVRCGQAMEDGYNATLRLLQQPSRPTALLAINDLLGLAAIRAAVDLGLHVPGDVSIGSFDNIPFGVYSVPRLTTVSGNPQQLGCRAFQLLLWRIQDPEHPQEVVRASSALIIRESTGPVPES
ncbi:MAG: LacI family transcriptional regulator [Anaerolineae bacterium]|nr:LacI family transcriptional regulator [Anaerolineae bacterium]